MITKSEIINLKKNGYIKFPAFLNKDEIKLIQEIAEKKKKNYLSKKYIEWDDPNLWKLICNKKLINIFDSIFEKKYYYMHDSNVAEVEIGNSWSWHRDNPCRRTGYGPDWVKSSPYDVFTVIIYLSDSASTSTSLSIIPKSHKFNFKKSLNNFLRIIHLRLKKMNKFLFIKKIIEKIVSKEIIYEAGDMVLFYCNLYHSGLNFGHQKTTKRTAAVIRYGGEGLHSKNFINYELNYRQGKQKYSLCENKNDFFNLLKKNNLYISPDITKYDIDHVFVPKDEDPEAIYY
tara:strand:- start:1808 stop:2668 length:861 start_codon:yes stop_codon:yes gene_type:complete